MSNVQVQLGGNSVQVQVQSSGFARANAAVTLAADSATAAAASVAAAAATLAAAALKANNLSDLASASAARTNLGLTALATTTPGTGVAAALAINVGSAGAPVVLNGAGGTPSSMTLTNATGLPVAGGGTGASTASGARANLGAGAVGDAVFVAANTGAAQTALALVPGTNVQAYDADLAAIAALTSAADKVPYATGAGTWALADLSAFARTLLAGANQAAFLAALGQIDNVETDFVQAGTGAVTVTTQAKLRQASVQPNSGEFGAFTNATVTTATLLAAFTHAMAAGRVVELAGDYTINGPITPTTAVDGAELRLFIRDDVTITVDAGSTAFNRVFYAESTTAKSHAISGNGTLTIDCNNKAAAGIWLRHTAASTGGQVIINAPVHVKNLTGATGFSTVSGILVLGRYERIVIRSPTVEDVTRVDASGECSGIGLSGFDGEVEIYSPVIRRVLIGGGAADADGIKCFGRQSGTTYNRREGSVRIYDPVFEDCQVRSYKDQCGDTVIYRPVVKRNASVLVGTSDGVDFDFQYGGGLILEPRIEYYKTGSTSPLGASHSVVAFQQVVDNSEMYGAIRNCTVISDVQIPRFGLLVTRSTAYASTTEVDGLTMLPVNGFTSTMIERGLLEFDASTVGAKTTRTAMNVKNTSGPTTPPIIAYTGYATLDSGTATAGAATTLTDSGKSWTANVYAGFLVRITAGTGSGQIRTIASNTATALTVAAAWTTNPDATSVYAISYSYAEASLDTGTATAGGATTLTAGAEAWTTDQWAGRQVRINAGTGASQTRTIASNTATVLTVTAAWTTNPDATSTFTILGDKLSITVDKCETTLAIAGQGSRAFANISGNEITDPGSFMIGENPGYRNFYGQRFCPKTMRAGCKIILYLDDTDTKFVDTDLNTTVSVPWGTTGNLYLECKGISNFGTTTHDTIIEARLNSSTVSPSAWFTQYGGVTWMALN